VVLRERKKDTQITQTSSYTQRKEEDKESSIIKSRDRNANGKALSGKLQPLAALENHRLFGILTRKEKFGCGHVPEERGSVGYIREEAKAMKKNAR